MRKHTLLLVLASGGLALAGGADLADLESGADEVVHIDLNAATLRAMSRLAGKEAGEDARFLQALAGATAIKVTSLEFHDGAMPETEDLNTVRANVAPAGWTEFLSSRSSEPEEMVKGYIGSSGLAIVVAEPGEITSVHVEGIFPGSAVPLLGGRFGLPRLGSDTPAPTFAKRDDPPAVVAVRPEKLDFKRMVHQVETQTGAHHLHIPLMGLARPAAYIASGRRAKALDFAVFERAPDTFVASVDHAVPEGWTRMVEVREGKEATNIYVGAVDEDMPLLIATWDGDGVLMTVKASLKDFYKSPLAWADEGHHPDD